MSLPGSPRVPPGPSPCAPCPSPLHPRARPRWLPTSHASLWGHEVISAHGSEGNVTSSVLNLLPPELLRDGSPLLGAAPLCPDALRSPGSTQDCPTARCRGRGLFLGATAWLWPCVSPGPQPSLQCPGHIPGIELETKQPAQQLQALCCSFVPRGTAHMGTAVLLEGEPAACHVVKQHSAIT